MLGENVLAIHSALANCRAISPGRVYYTVKNGNPAAYQKVVISFRYSMGMVNCESTAQVAI